MIDINKQYILLNYNTSPLAVPMKDGSIIIEGGKDGAPTSYPFTLNEILYIFSNTKLLQFGYLTPKDEDKAEVFGYLRYTNYDKILTYPEIEDMILSPTLEKMERLIAIREVGYFERVYGTYIGLKSTGAPINGNVCRIITTRYKELCNRKRDTEIVLKKRDIEAADEFVSASQYEAMAAEKDKKVDELTQQVEKLTALITQMNTGKQEIPVETTDTATKKTATTRTSNRATSKKKE